MSKHLFIAIKINPSLELLNKIDFLENNLKHELINWIKKDHYHLTLRFLGEISERRIPTIIKSLQKVFSQEYSFTLGINSLGLFGSTYNPRVLWLGVDEIVEIKTIHQKVELELKRIGFPSDNQNFIPHISIARIKKLHDKKFFHSLILKPKFETIQSQEVTEVILYESILSTKGAEYQIVEIFPLADTSS